MARLIYGEISSLTGREGYCWASNKHFKSIFGISVVSVSKHINLLLKLGFITVDIDKDDGNFRKIWLVSTLRPVQEIFSSPINGNLNNPINENLNKDTHILDTHNNIYTHFKEKINQRSLLTEEAKRKIGVRLKTFTCKQLIESIDRFSLNKWWMKHNKGRGLAWFFNSDDRIDQFLNLEPEERKKFVNG